MYNKSMLLIGRGKFAKRYLRRSMEFVGWYGVAAVLVAYFSISMHILTAQSLLYFLLNATGALSIVAHSYHKRDLQPLVLNLIWLLIAVIGLIKFDFAGTHVLIG